MQFISTLFSISTFFLSVAARPAATVEMRSSIVSIDQFKNWLASQDPANITFVGKPLGDLSDLSKRDAVDTIVTFCPISAGNICTGACTVSHGSDLCISAPGTNCLFATQDVAFCDGGNCDGSCNSFSSCGTRLDNGFCATPGTSSIAVAAGAPSS